MRFTIAAILRDGATVEEVYGLLAPDAKAAVDAARAHRAGLAAVRGLTELTVRVESSRASDLGITVLRELNGFVRVGMIDIPPLNLKLVPPPKSE